MLGAALFDYFTDPVLRAPMIGSILMCLSAALIGVIVFLKKQSLIGEALSHAAYPGVVCGVIFVGVLFGDSTSSPFAGVAMLTGAFLTAILGSRMITWLENKHKVNADAALCFTLSFFFGIGITLASHIQFSFSNLYRQVQIYFYGQAATMTDIHILIYGILVLFVLTSLFILRKEFKIWLFDPIYSKVIGINTKMIGLVFLLLATLSIVIGIRSVGVVLMSAMLIAPAAAARQCTSHLKTMFLLAAIFGISSAGLGTYLANELSTHAKVSLPTGPMIVLIAASICILALAFAPEKGLIFRMIRIIKFRSTCLNENLLKTLWREGKHKPCTFDVLKKHLFVASLHLQWALFRLSRQGWIQKTDGSYSLTKDGILRAEKVIRLHRLWELYLADYVGLGAQRVHSSAEEMEHILTPELEKELTRLLNNPKEDPHHQPIPQAPFKEES
jgi:manganese/zinc/iron transport system permease protein